MDRNEFLSKFWSRYPAIQESALDVSSAFSFLDSENLLLIGGRLTGEQGHWTLSSGGATCAVQFDQKCRWSDSATSFSASILNSDDIILIKARVAGVMDAVVFHVCEVQLLAPCFAQAKHDTSSEVTVIQQWGSFLKVIREFFIGERFTEVQTPTLVPSPGTEPYLDVFITEFVSGEDKRQFFLPTSPEFHLKKLLARGHTKIFEIKSCFRNGEVSEHHQPEFQMLEWYRAYAGLGSIIKDIDNLLASLRQTFPSRKIASLQITTMAELFLRNCEGFVLRPDVSRDELFSLCQKFSLHPRVDDTWDDLFFRIVIEKIEPNIDKDIPTIVRNYPKPQAALARIAPDGWAQRFEFYWQGLEIANAFDELNDPQQNELRFKSDLEKRLQSGRPSQPIDKELIEAFYSGMPPAGGIALGLERLFMALFEIKNIAQLKAFSIGL